MLGGKGGGLTATPSGPAGGDLSGNYPNPTVAVKTSQAISALDVNWSLGFIFTKTISTNSVFTFSNIVDGKTIVIQIINSNSSTVTWPTVKWAGGTPPTQTVSATDVYTFIDIGGTIYGSVVQNLS